MESTHRLAAIKRASNATGDDLSYDEGISDLFALGNMPPETILPYLGNSRWMVNSVDLARLIHRFRVIACDGVGGPAHTKGHSG